jgi:hypothetical protein
MLGLECKYAYDSQLTCRFGVKCRDVHYRTLKFTSYCYNVDERDIKTWSFPVEPAKLGKAGTNKHGKPKLIHQLPEVGIALPRSQRYPHGWEDAPDRWVYDEFIKPTLTTQAQKDQMESKIRAKEQAALIPRPKAQSSQAPEPKLKKVPEAYREHYGNNVAAFVHDYPKAAGQALALQENKYHLGDHVDTTEMPGGPSKAVSLVHPQTSSTSMLICLGIE